jgi:EAL domain-containing protein (putative c-di-GMP-specific phosphodiesterase class I)/GGDEF domain-containing protein
MTERRIPRKPFDYRTGYLKMKTVLQDRVTGLPAYPLLFDRLRALLEERRSVGVLHVDVVDLEMVESLYGWQVFDGVVARVADVLRASVGGELPASSLIALDGVAGGRFVLFVPERPDGADTDGAFLTDVGQAMCRRLEQAFDDDATAGLSPGLRFRAGHALLSQDPFYRFERCVYAAVGKAGGTHARRERRRELSWGEELRSIIRGGSVRALFQPVVELETRRVVGHEALARGPRDSVFETPRAMFALSDRVGIANELDRLCVEVALASSADLRERRKLFLNVRPASLNGSVLRQETFRSTLDRHGFAASDLVLEVSERAAGDDPEPFIERLTSFKAQGFEVALDDVGTGRAGLKTVERIEPDYLKMDISLVRNLDESLMQREILATLVQLADRIGGAVVGEGVEREAEAAALVAGGARYGQGHLFALPADPRTMRARTGKPGAPREP